MGVSREENVSNLNRRYLYPKYYTKEIDRGFKGQGRHVLQGYSHLMKVLYRDIGFLFRGGNGNGSCRC